MKDTILVNICADHTWECSTSVIGRTGEGCTSQFTILLTKDEMCNFSARLKFKKPNGKKFKTSYLNIENNIITYNIPKLLLTESGKLQVQLILEKESGEVWKSSVKTYYVLESISADDRTIDIGITPTGTIDIITNGTHDVSIYANANIEVKGEPYEFETEEQMDAFLGSPYCKLGDIILYNENYYKVVNDGEGTEKYCVKISSAEGTLELTTNGTYDVTQYSMVNIDVKGKPYEFETEEQMDAFLGSPMCQKGDIIKFIGDSSSEYDKNFYYVVEQDGEGTEMYYSCANY